MTLGLEITDGYKNIVTELSLNVGSRYLLQNTGKSDVLITEQLSAPDDDTPAFVVPEEAMAKIIVPRYGHIYAKADGADSELTVALID